MLAEPLPLLLLVIIWIIFFAIQYGAQKNFVNINIALGNLAILTIIGVTIYEVFQHEASSIFLPFAALYIVLHNRTYMEMKKIGEGRELNRILGKTALNIFCFGIVSSLIIIGMAN